MRPPVSDAQIGLILGLLALSIMVATFAALAQAYGSHRVSSGLFRVALCVLLGACWLGATTP